MIILLWSFIDALWLIVFLIITVTLYMIIKLKKVESDRDKINDMIFNETESDKAIFELKRAKEKLDLGVITQEEYEKIKEKLKKYIK